MTTFYKANDKYNANLSSGYVAGQSTMDVNVAPASVPTIITVAKGTSKEATFSITGKTVNSLTGVVRLKGYSGNLDAQMPITCLNNEEFVNQYSGAVSTPESLIQIHYGVDGGSTDAYAISLDVAPAEYMEGLAIVFKANTSNTGASTLNVNTLGIKSIKLKGEDLSDNAIVAGQIVTVVYDGTNFQLQSAGGSGKIRFAWYLDGTESVRDEAGMKFIAPSNLKVKNIKYICKSGTATIRIQKGTTDIASGMSVSSVLGTKDSSFTTDTITAGDILSLDITVASTPVDISVQMECE